MDFSRCNKKLWWLSLPILVVVIVVVVVVCVLVFRDDATEDTTTAATTATTTVTTTNPMAPEVTISQGALRGMTLDARSGRTIYGFKGIPYAEPPVGELRFQAPVASGPWNGIFDADSDTSDCIQPEGGDEDCLYLNVYTPQLPTSGNSELLPVMVYIHGGGFNDGSNNATSYGPGFLLDKDVVLVVPSYRLGIFGFLSTADEVVPGNNGLKDLVVALEWIQDNIAYFGGDPDRVTIFGQSAGAMITQLLALSSSTDGLIHRYISQSGSALTYDAHRPRAVLADRAFRVGEYVDCPTRTSTDLVNCLRGVDAALLIELDAIFKIWGNSPMAIWSPTTEPDVEGAFLTEDPAKLMSAGGFKDLPWLCIVNRDEQMNRAVGNYRGTKSEGVMLLVQSNHSVFAQSGLRTSQSVSRLVGAYDQARPLGRLQWPPLFSMIIEAHTQHSFSTADRSQGKPLTVENSRGLAANPGDFQYLLDNLDIALPVLLTIDTRVENATAYADAVRSYYLNDLTVDPDLLVRNISTMFSDAVFAYTTWKANQYLLAHTSQPLFFGSFEYRGSVYGSTYNGGDLEVVHNDDLIYLFPSTNDGTMNETDNEMIDIMVEFWTSFAADGTPASVWDQYSSLDNYLRIGGPFDTSLEVRYNYFSERMEFWDELTAATTWL